MRMTRTLAALVALIASFALAITLAPANAEEGATTQATFGRFNAELNSDGKLIAKGQASKWKRKPVQLQRAPKGTNNWTTFKTLKTDGRGNFRYVVRPGSDIPCSGTKEYKIRAKKKGRPAAKVDDDLWYC